MQRRTGVRDRAEARADPQSRCRRATTTIVSARTARRPRHDVQLTRTADVYDFELSADDMSRLDALDQGDAGAISWNPVNVA